MELFEHVPVTPNQGKDNYTKFETHTDKCIQLFRLLNEVFDFLKAEYSDLAPRKDEYPKFAIKMNSIATIGNALNTRECREAIQEGYRLYVKENKRIKS